MRRLWAMSDLTREELRRAAGRSILLVPIGATEQHGPHLAVGTDHLVAEHVAHQVAELLDETPIIVAPTLPVGLSQHHLPFGGTLSFTPETFFRMLVEVGESAVKSGFASVFFLNGHGGNVEVAAAASREVTHRTGRSSGSGSYWIMSWGKLVAEGMGADARLPGHAGAFETSIVLALQSDLVPVAPPSRDGDFGRPGSSFFGPYHESHPGAWEAIDGWSDSPIRASAELGKRILSIVVEETARGVKDFASNARMEQR
jgi:creatinine amidohydrolase